MNATLSIIVISTEYPLIIMEFSVSFFFCRSLRIFPSCNDVELFYVLIFLPVAAHEGAKKREYRTWRQYSNFKGYRYEQFCVDLRPDLFFFFCIYIKAKKLWIKQMSKHTNTTSPDSFDLAVLQQWSKSLLLLQIDFIRTLGLVPSELLENHMRAGAECEPKCANRP